ncbi:MAG: hypothetical protein QOD69_2864 [Solirubrobacteraceae bacterium]|nr:hypothetical protein [Solirubrobacteraceae bacterium]
MAQTKKKRRSKHRGNAAGVVEARGRAGHRRADVKLTDKELAAQRRRERMLRPPSWKSAIIKAAAAAALLAVLGIFVLKETLPQALSLTVFVFLFYLPLGYYTDTWIYNRRMRSEAKAKT